MTKVFLSYARADGSEAAARLRAELEAMGFEVWRDVEEMEGGLAWKEQLRNALRQVDALLVLLTPGAARSRNVEWEWENALALEKRVIGALVAACEVPEEFKRLHYHDLSDAATYSLGLARMARDLLRLESSQRRQQAAPGRAESKYQVGTAIGSSIGDGATTVNAGGVDPELALRVLGVLKAHGAAAPEAHAQMVEVLAEIQRDVKQGNARLDQLRSGQQALLEQYQAGEQRILAGLLERLDAQELALSVAVVRALESRAPEPQEAAQHLAAIEDVLREVKERTAEIGDRQLAASAAAVADMIKAPELDVTHKLKLSVPLIPLLLSYEGEVAWKNGLNLEKAWEWLRKSVARQQE